MRFPSLRISLLTLFILVTVAGPGAGLAIRQWREWAQKSNHYRATKLVEACVAQARQAKTDWDHHEDQLKQISFMVDCSEIFTTEERVGLRQQLDGALRDLRRKAIAQERGGTHACWVEGEAATARQD